MEKTIYDSAVSMALKIKDKDEKATTQADKHEIVVMLFDLLALCLRANINIDQLFDLAKGDING